MSLQKAQSLKATTSVHADWKFEFAAPGDNQDTPPLLSLTREFHHPDYWSGARFLAKLAAVAQLQNHFPAGMRLDRRIVVSRQKKKNWQVVSRVECSTVVLGGLSGHDFYLAMVRGASCVVVVH